MQWSQIGHKSTDVGCVVVIFGVWCGSYNILERLEEVNGAEGETRTRTGLLPLDPEPSVSTSSTTSALEKLHEK